MPSISRLTLAFGLLVFVVGVTSGGWGVYQQATDSCESGYGVSVSKLGANETGLPNAEHVAYSNLSESEQRVFREILAADRTPIYHNTTPLTALSRTVVTYQGERYETTPLFVSDCTSVGGSFVVWGGLVAVLGAAVVVTTTGWRRFR